MLAAWNSLLAGLPVLVAQLATTTILFAVGMGIYLWVTPYRDMELIRRGNVAAAIAVSGQALALAIPLGAMLASSVSVPDIVIWGIAAVALQLIAFAVAAVVLRGMAAAIERGEIASAIVLATIQIVAGILNAAAMSG